MDLKDDIAPLSERSIDSYETAPTVTSLDYSDTYAIIHRSHLKNDTKMRVEIPKGLESVKLCRVMIWYLQSSDFLKVSSLTRHTYATYASLFLKFLAETLPDSNLRVPNGVLKFFKQWLIKNNPRYPEAQKKPLRHVIAAINAFIDAEEKPAVLMDIQYHVLLAHAPKIRERHSKPVQSLMQLFPNCQYTDTEMIKSLRSVCSIIVFEFQRQRELLLTHSAIIQVMNDELSTLDFNQPLMSYGVWTDDKQIKEDRDLNRRLYARLVEVIIELNDPLLLERLHLSYKQMDHTDISGASHPNTEQITALLKASIFHKEGTSYLMTDIRFNKKRIGTLGKIESISYSNLFLPSDIEIFFIQCLLASERKQRASLNKLMLSDFIGDQKLQIISDKGRRGRYSTTPSLGYDKNTIIRDVYQTYVNTLTDAQSRLSKEQQGKALPFQTTELSKGHIGLYETIPTRFFDLLTNPDSEFNRTLHDRLKGDEKPFFWFIQQILAHNRKITKQRRINKYKGKDAAPGKSVTTKKNSSRVVGLAPNFIGKSAVNMDSRNSVKQKGKDFGKKASSLPAEEQAKLTAEAKGHSISTNLNDYLDRSNSKESIADERSFVTQVGDLMEQDARKIAKVFSLPDLKKHLGLTNASDDFKQLLSEIDAEVGLTGEITTKDNQIIFVATDLTAALMLLRIAHINSEIGRLLINDKRDQALKAASDKIYLEYILKQFPESIKKDGEALAKALDMPFASLI